MPSLLVDRARRFPARHRHRFVGALLLGLLVVVAACSVGGAESFEPSGPCTSDGQRAGAYPQLEALVPATFDGAAPSTLDSGRHCTEASLGTLIRHGIREVRFAGGQWTTGSRSGVALAVFEAPGLTVERLAEFYEDGARGARKTDAITTAEADRGSVDGWRLDTLNDESFQTILVFEGTRPGLVRAALVASDVRETGTRAAHEARVASAVRAVVGD